MNNPQKTARLAGFFYLLVVIFGGFTVALRANLIVPENAAATASNILASQGLFRLGIVSDLVMMACYLMLAFTRELCWLMPLIPMSLKSKKNNSQGFNTEAR